MKRKTGTMMFWALLLGIVFIAGCNNTGQEGQTAVAVEESAAVMQQQPQSVLPEVVMYKSPSCQCCTGWAEHLRNAGFTVIEHKRDDMEAVKAQYGIPENLASCHTALVDGYIIEGHVPADDVKRLLKERPQVAGLTAPGMPMQSPGMQEEGKAPRNYQVLSFDKTGHATVFRRY